jgi:putative chitinase
MTFTFTEEQLAKIIPGNQYVAEWHNALTTILPEYDIWTPERVAHFMAQTAHESGSYSALTENLNYRAETMRKVFPKYFPTAAIAESFVGHPDRLANKVYGNRMGNGDEASGDGYRFRGRGLIQLTGRENYTRFAESIEMPVNDASEYLETFEGAVQGACWYWEDKNLNALADANDIIAITKKINGGTIGLEDRKARYANAIKVLSA